ncbi:MAG: hypothetical protein ACOCRO_03655 [Halanaerobiales bacterium]
MHKKGYFLFVLIIYLSIVSFSLYAIEISGDYERGERIYIEIEELEDSLDEVIEYKEEIADCYYYNKVWFRFKQQLDKSAYYYVKLQYNAREYQEKKNFDNTTYDIWTNYTFRITDSIRNRLNFDFRNKNYFSNQDNTYNQYRLVYQLDYQYNDFHDYNFYIQRRWKDYSYRNNKNNIYDRLSLAWTWKSTESLTINSRVSFDRENFKPESASSNKKGSQFNIGFKWKL